MNITDFLLARIDEDEALARGATPGPWSSMTEETGNGENIYYTVEHGTDQLCDMALTSRQGHRDAEHIARHDPGRVLAECAAKRAIIDMHVTYVNAVPESVGIAFVGARCGQEVTSDALKLLADVYKDHPDYRTEWA